MTSHGVHLEEPTEGEVNEKLFTALKRPRRFTWFDEEAPPSVSPMHFALRKWLIYDVFGGPDVAVDGSASAVASLLAYALEKRFAAVLEETQLIAADLADQHTDDWGIYANIVAPTTMFTGIGYPGSSFNAVALTGPSNDNEAWHVAEALVNVPVLIRKILTALETP